MWKKLTEAQFWVLSLTWGFIMTLIGAICFSALKICGFKHYKQNYAFVIEVGKGWGGVSMGPFIFVSQKPSQHTLYHEFGHSLQNCYWGPNMVFVSLMSAARYWYREYLVKAKEMKYSELPNYDCIWFEGIATYLGTAFNREE